MESSEDEEDEQSELVDFGEAYTDIQEPLPPLRKRDWKCYHKELQQAIKTSPTNDGEVDNLLMWSSL